MSFNFAFANDDIEDNTNGVECNLHSPVSPLEKYMQPTEPKIHRLEELVRIYDAIEQSRLQGIRSGGLLAFFYRSVCRTFD